MRNSPKPHPILLAAGPSPRLGFSESLAKFGGRNAIEIAVENCAGLPKPVVVLGHRAASLARHVPQNAKIVVNKNWRSGQLGSLLAGLRDVPLEAEFLLYPVDHVFLTPQVICCLVRALEKAKKEQKIFMPRFKGHPGHPVIFSAEMRHELQNARTAREVVYRDPRRICYVSVRTPAIWKDLHPPTGAAPFRRN
jgi:CTP:molybdopterin cytidylyltransferase MocA